MNEQGYENLKFGEWTMLTGLPLEAYEEWVKLDPQSRRDVVAQQGEPASADELREM